MGEVTKGGISFIGYEYKEVPVKKEMVSIYVDAYKNLGWILDQNGILNNRRNHIEIKIKRDKKILNKTELTRLQRNFEACMEEINQLEKSKTSAASAVAIAIGLLGTAFIALSTFAVTHNPPLIVPCILFAVPGFIGWGLPSFIYKIIVNRRTEKIMPMIEQKYDEVYGICEKGNHLLF